MKNNNIYYFYYWCVCVCVFARRARGERCVRTRRTDCSNDFPTTDCLPVCDGVAVRAFAGFARRRLFFFFSFVFTRHRPGAPVVVVVAVSRCLRVGRGVGMSCSGGRPASLLPFRHSPPIGARPPARTARRAIKRENRTAAPLPPANRAARSSRSLSLASFSHTG